MKPSVFIFGIATALLTGCQTKSDFARSNFDDLPVNVQTAVNEQVGDADILKVDRERRVGGWVYNVHYASPSGPGELSVREDGAILRTMDPDRIEEAAGAEME